MTNWGPTLIRVIKVVVGGTAGPAMAVPLFWSKMFWTGPLFLADYDFFLCCVIFSADHHDQRLSNNIDN